MYVRISIYACTGIKTHLNLVKLKELLKFLTPRHLLSAQPKKKSASESSACRAMFKQFDQVMMEI